MSYSQSITSSLAVNLPGKIALISRKLPFWAILSDYATIFGQSYRIITKFEIIRTALVGDATATDSCILNPIRSQIKGYETQKSYFCVKSVGIRSYSGPHFPTFGLNTERYCISPYSIRMWENADQNDFKYGYFLRCVFLLFLSDFSGFKGYKPSVPYLVRCRLWKITSA